MTGFLATQLDFILFFYGLAFVVLGGVCFAAPAVPGFRTYSGLLGSFGVAHGASEWLDLIALLAGDSPVFAVARTALMTASFLFLLEFARRHAIHFGLRISAPLIYLALILLVGLCGMKNGVIAANVVARITIGLTSSLATAGVLFGYSGRLSGMAQRLLQFAAAGFVLYGVAAGAIVPSAPFWPASVFNYDTFSNATGLPIQLVRGLLACWITAALWALWKRMVAAGVDSERYSASQNQITKWTLVATATTLVAGWGLTQYLGGRYQHTVEQESALDIALLTSLLDRETSMPDAVANAVARAPSIVSFLSGGGKHDVELAQSVLDLAIAASGAQLAVIADTSSAVVASSGNQNFHIVDSPSSSFLEAGAHFIFDPASGHLNYRATAPIRAATGSMAGTVSLIKSLESMQADLSHFSRPSFLIDPDGVVLMTNRPETLLRPLWPLSLAKHSALANRYGETGNRPMLVEEVPDATWARFLDQRQYLRRRFAAHSQWSLVVAIPDSGIYANRFLGIVITFLMSIMTMIYLYGRERAIRDNVEVEARLHLLGVAKGFQEMAATDSLTGVSNRSEFNEALGREIVRAKRHKTPLSLVIYDIDHFKRVNDTYGHLVGDSLLIEMSRLVSRHLRPSDLLARWGGEEFVILTPGCDHAAAYQTAERLRALISQTVFEQVGAVTVSFGVAQYVPGDTAGAIFSRADSALFRAKGGGRNRVESAG